MHMCKNCIPSMHILWISCLYPGITHPGKIPTGDFPVCCSALPRDINNLTHKDTHKTTKLQLLHIHTATTETADMYLCCPPRQTIGIDWFRKDAAKGLQRRRARSGRRATRVTINRGINRSINRGINQSVSRRINRNISQGISRSISKARNKSN